MGGFKLHVTDVFLEELAKAAEEKLSTDNLEIILEPFLKAVKTSDEARYRDHVVERIFRHLLRQSDPGIKWQDEEFAGEDEEDADDDDELDNEKMEGEDESDVEEEGDSSVKLGEDPRAGGVHSVIPQLAVDYAKLSEKMFSLGSEEGLKKGCRDALYELSKMYKDVANDVFPLGPNLEDVEEDIKKIKVTKTAKKIIREAKEYKKKNIEQKKKYKKGLREEEREQEMVDQNSDGGEVDDSEDNEDEGDDRQDKENNANKLSSKELQKARKREQKKRKRERLLKEKQANEEALAKEKEEKENKNKEAKVLIDKDIERKNVESVKAESNKQKKKKGVLTDKENELEENVKAHEVLEKKKKKKRKAEEKNIAIEPELKINHDLTLNQDTSSGEPKKKKKKKKRMEDNTESKEEEHLINIEVKDQDNDNTETETAVLPKKKTVKCDNDEKIEPVIDETASPPKKLKVSEEPMMIKPSQLTTEALETAKEKKKKKKLKKKAIYRIDSDIAFNAPSLSQTNLVNHVSEPPDSNSTSIKSDEPVAKDIPAPAPTSEQKLQKSAEKKKLKKMKKYNAETSLIVNPEETPIIKTPPSVLAFADSTPTSSKTKSNGDLSGSGAAPKNAKIFDENNSWAEDLKPGETEIFVPNKKFKGPDTISGSVPGSPSPMVTPAKSFTATFLKKAMSKSDKKGEKKPKIPDHKAMSEPRKKKVNVVLTKNCAQDFSQHLKSVKNSPQTPHDPNKNPVKSVLKKTPGSETATSLNPVNLNTQLNARSKAAKMLNGKSSRKRAMDFF